MFAVSRVTRNFEKKKVYSNYDRFLYGEFDCMLHTAIYLDSRETIKRALTEKQWLPLSKNQLLTEQELENKAFDLEMLNMKQRIRDERRVVENFRKANRTPIQKSELEKLGYKLPSAESGYESDDESK